MKKNQYNLTLFCCSLGMFIQAIGINLTPILFIPFKELFGISYAQIGTLILINFTTQLIFDVTFSGAVDKFGYRIFATVSHIAITAGLIMLAFTPHIAKTSIPVFIWLILSTILFSMGCGLIEIVLSPVVNSIPSDEKANLMSFIHSFYAWGQLTVILGTTVLLFLLGTKLWWVIVLIWAVIPILNTALFLKAKMPSVLHQSEQQSIKSIFKRPIFIVAFFMMFFAGATEVTLAQWSSAYVERVFEMPKILGDLGGIAMLALFMSLGRTAFGIWGKRLNLNNIMILGASGAAICYLIIALCPITSIVLIACAMSGLFVCLLWPGTLSLTSGHFPLAGAWMFAMLAAGGDVGASVGPWLCGFVADNLGNVTFFANLAKSLQLTIEQIGLKGGILISTVFPILAFILLLVIKLNKTKINKEEL